MMGFFKLGEVVFLEAKSVSRCILGIGAGHNYLNSM